MGLFDNIFKSIDDTLKEIENGGLEKKIVEGIDNLGRMADKAPEALEKVAEAPKKALDTFDTKGEALQQVAQNVKQQAQKTIDIMKRPD
jgi:predicted RecB family endonuclease